jgi:PilZ domain
VSSLPRDPQPDHGFGDIAVERRRSHREPIVAIGRLTPVDAGPTLRTFQVLVTDVSLHGCDFKSALAPTDGALYRIEINVGPLAMTSRLRVIRLASRADGTFEAGAEFI